MLDCKRKIKAVSVRHQPGFCDNCVSPEEEKIKGSIPAGVNLFFVQIVFLPTLGCSQIK